MKKNILYIEPKNTHNKTKNLNTFGFLTKPGPTCDAKKLENSHRSNVYVSGKIIKCSLFLRQRKVYQPARSQRKKGAKKNI
jgi:hypothetical protein